MNLQEFDKQRGRILANANDLLAAATKLPTNLGHIRYHLAALAKEYGDGSQLDDHIKKLFWALWGASGVEDRFTLTEFEACRELARKIHRKRLATLYVDPLEVAPVTLSEKEVQNLV